MLITVDNEDRRPIYQQVADEIMGLIARGELREGQPLPPVRQLAGDLGVNLNTIATAYRELQAQGLISIRHGSGAVVLPRDATRKMTASDKDDLRKPLRKGDFLSRDPREKERKKPGLKRARKAPTYTKR